MKAFILLRPLFAILSSFLIAQTSSAYLQYTYSSDVLEWQSTLLNDEDFGEEINSDEDKNIFFNYSFNIDENLLSSTTPTSFIINNADVYSERSLGDPYFEPDFHSVVFGKVIINSDKTIRYWNLTLDLAINAINEYEIVNKLSDHDIRILSKGGLSTCNCDRLWEDINLTTRRPHDTWIITSTVDNYYRSANDFDNWSVNQLSVMESNPLPLVAIGLLGLLAMRGKKAPTIST